MPCVAHRVASGVNNRSLDDKEDLTRWCPIRREHGCWKPQAWPAELLSTVEIVRGSQQHQLHAGDTH